MKLPTGTVGRMPASYCRSFSTLILHPASGSLPCNFPTNPNRTIPPPSILASFSGQSSAALPHPRSLLLSGNDCVSKVIVCLSSGEHRSSWEIVPAPLDASNPCTLDEDWGNSGYAGNNDTGPRRFSQADCEGPAHTSDGETRLPSGFDENKLSNGPTQGKRGARERNRRAPSLVESAAYRRIYPYLDRDDHA
jgi:hypothetical protein